MSKAREIVVGDVVKIYRREELGDVVECYRLWVTVQWRGGKKEDVPRQLLIIEPKE